MGGSTVMESAIDVQPHSAHIPFQKAGRAERVARFNLAPDFFIPVHEYERIA